MICFYKFGDIMNEILGGIADWLHENGVKTSYDVVDEKWRRKVGFLNFIKKSSIYPILGVYSTDNNPIHFCWIDGTILKMRGALPIYQAGDIEPYPMMGTGTIVLFELADPGFLDELLSQVR